MAGISCFVVSVLSVLLLQAASNNNEEHNALVIIVFIEVSSLS
jgi:hypothetical protein